jgi:hypothetical protein
MIFKLILGRMKYTKIQKTKPIHQVLTGTPKLEIAQNFELEKYTNWR